MARTVVLAALLLLGTAAAMPQVDNDTPKLNLTVFFETLCPDCINFFVNQLHPTMAELGDYMTVDVTAYGFSSDTPAAGGGYSFTCQHGPNECYGNKMMACARQHLPSPASYIQFAVCAMVSKYPPYAAQDCASSMEEYAAIYACETSTEGEVLLHDIGVLQKEAAPNMNWSPYMIVDGKHTATLQDDAEHHLKQLVCDQYGGVKPAACT